MGCQVMKPGWRLFAGMTLAVLLLFCPVRLRVFSAPDASAAETPVDAGSAEFLKTIQETLVAEENGLTELRERLAQLQSLEKAIHTELNAYRIQNSAHTSLILLPSVGLKELEKAAGDNRQAVNALQERLKDFSKRRESIQALGQQAEEQIRLGEIQRAEIRSGRWPKADTKAMLDALGRLQKRVADKQAVLKQLYEKQGSVIDSLTEARGAAMQLAERFEQQIRSRSTQELFDRKLISAKAFSAPALMAEFRSLGDGIGRFLDGRFWTEEGLRIQESGTMPLMTLAVLVFIGVLFVVRVRSLLGGYERRLSADAFPWRRYCLILIRRSVIFLGAAGVLYGYDSIQFPHFKLPVIRLLLNLIFVWILTGWALNFLRLWEPSANREAAAALKPGVRRMARTLGIFATVYLLTAWWMRSDSLLLYGLRLGLEAGLLVWCYRFWKRFVSTTATASDAPPKKWHTPAVGISYLVTVGGLVMELAGYPILTVYWYVSWAKTAAVLFWIVLLFRVIREWQRDYRPSFWGERMTDPETGDHPLKLFFIQAAWLFWVMCLLDGLILAWSTNWEVFLSVYGFMNRPWTIGKIHLSIAGLIYAVIILFLTHTLSRLGRYLLAERILRDSPMESGLQASITSISVYLMWALGIVLMLGVLGVDTTSLAVIFGALSIGIGFGLQNIFNNFISGIILLFERPIQVGDAVEIGGIWGEVKKINVRATVVQTYDNASLIIPNSEFISSQVTNWSFKDQRLRRKLNIGVAYGSDIEKVRATLLEIAGRTSDVLRNPPPDVIFADHGDSALIFTLRYWTTIDYFWTTSTDIRFELDRRFRELGIEIAFPQRDIHIRTIAKDSEERAPVVADPAPKETQ